MAKASCTVPACGRPTLARGWCARHYQRWRLYGDPQAPNPRSPVVNPDGTRTCKTCGTAKPLEDYPKDANASAGRRADCKPCHSKKASAWYADNRERALERFQAHREANRDRIRQQDSERYYRDKPKRLALVIDAGNRRRATLRHGGPWDRGITHRALRERDGDLCRYCGITMSFDPCVGHVYVPIRATIEHVIPISQGGTHTWGNVVLACWQCNVRKQARTPEQWMERPDSQGGVTDAAQL